MRKKLLVSLGLLIGLAVSGFLVISWWMASNHRINCENYARIQAGMTMQEVSDLLGCAPHARPGQFIGMGGTILTMTIESSAHVWQTDNFWQTENFRIFVVFDTNEIATGAKTYSTWNRTETISKKLRRWFCLAGA